MSRQLLTETWHHPPSFARATMLPPSLDFEAGRRREEREVTLGRGSERRQRGILVLLVVVLDDDDDCDEGGREVGREGNSNKRRPKKIVTCGI